MRYLFVHAEREWSGAARAFTDVARGLIERGHDVSMVVEPESTVERIVSQTTASSLNGGAMAGKPPRAQVQIEPIALNGSWFLTALRLRSLIKSSGAKVVFVHTNREHLAASFACWLGGGARIVRRVPAGQNIAPRWAGRFATWLTPTCFLFSNEHDARTTVVPRRAATRAVAPLGIELPDLDRLEPAIVGAAREYIVCVHDDSSRSRAATAIRTLAMLVPRHPGLKLIILGEGAYDDDLRMQAAALRVLNLVTFLGERDDALHVMRGARLGWVVADADTAAYALLDFMSLAVPVLSG